MIIDYKGARMWQTKTDILIHNNYDIKLKVLLGTFSLAEKNLYGHLLAFPLIRKHFHNKLK